MEIVLGVSMTPTAIRMVAVEGDHADGVTVDHDVFAVASADDAAKSDATEHVVAALVGTRQSALEAGHDLLSTGITCGSHDDAAALRRALTAEGFDDVAIISEELAAGALAQAAGQAVGDERTALLLIGSDTATLSVVQTADGAVMNTRFRHLDDTDAGVALADLVDGLDSNEPAPGSLFLICPDQDTAAFADILRDKTPLPVSAPQHSGLALARGAALASTHTNAELLTMGLAYSLDDDLGTEPGYVAPQRKPLFLVGSVLSIFVLGVAALVISVAVSIRLTSSQHTSPPQAAAPPVAAAPSVQNTPPVKLPPPPAPASASPPLAPRPTAPPAPAPMPVQHRAPIHRNPVVKRPTAVPLATPTPAPAPAAPAPPVAEPPVAPVPAAPPPPPPRVPPILQQIFPFLRQPRYEQPYQPYPEPAGPGYGGGYYGGYEPRYPSY